MKSHQDFDKYAETHSMGGDIPVYLKKELNKIKPKSSVLDFGAGDGKVLMYLSKRIDKKNLFGTEVSKKRVQRVRKKGFRCDLISQVKPKLNFKNNTFDYTLMIEVIEHIPKENLEYISREIKRVLKNGGKLIATTPNYPIKRIYDYLGVFNKKKSFSDDPTHITKYNFNKLKNSLSDKFKQVRLASAWFILQDKFKIMKKLPKFFSHKILAVCEK